MSFDVSNPADEGRCYGETDFMMFIMHNGIGAFTWDVFSFFPTVKTKALNVLGFLP